jgi:hypothetical protein
LNSSSATERALTYMRVRAARIKVMWIIPADPRWRRIRVARAYHVTRQAGRGVRKHRRDPVPFPGSPG